MTPVRYATYETVASWTTAGLDGEGDVVYRGQVARHWDGKFVGRRWVCDHAHATRALAVVCAEDAMRKCPELVEVIR